MMSQVVLSPSADGSTELHIGAVRSNHETRTPKGSELHLGSQDLIRLAGYAMSHEFVASAFMLADASLVPLSREQQAEVSAEIIELLQIHGAAEVDAAMQDDYSGIFVIGVDLIAIASGMRISIRRRGYVETSIAEEAEGLLKSAWRELRLS